MLFSVIVKLNAPCATARVGGKNFSQLEATLINASELTDEIRNSPLLDVSAIAEPNTVAPTVEPNIEADAPAATPVLEPAEPNTVAPTVEPNIEADAPAATPVLEPAEPNTVAQRRRNRH